MGRKRTGNKNYQQQQNYKNAIRGNKYPVENTSEYIPDNLKGSNEIFPPNSDDPEKREVAKPPIGKQAGRFVEDNFSAIVMSALGIILTFCVWVAISMFSAQRDIKIIEKDIEHISSQVEKIQTQSVSKEILEYQIENLKRDLQDWINIDIDNVKDDLDAIKKTLKKLEIE